MHRGKENEAERGRTEKTARVRDRNREKERAILVIILLPWRCCPQSDYSTGASWVFSKDFPDWWRSLVEKGINWLTKVRGHVITSP